MGYSFKKAKSSTRPIRHSKNLPPEGWGGVSVMVVCGISIVVYIVVVYLYSPATCFHEINKRGPGMR